MPAERFTVQVSPGQAVSGLLLVPPDTSACYVMAHGAGAGMDHSFMEAVATGLAERGVATLRYQFSYMELGTKRPDAPPVAHATVRAATAAAGRLLPSVPLVAGGKSFGGRMTAQAQALEPLQDVLGLVFFGFPLHPAKKPSSARADHLTDVAIPMLFLQGARDALAETELLCPVIARLGQRATLEVLPDADHSFHVLVRSGRTDAEVLAGALDMMVRWVGDAGRRH